MVLSRLCLKNKKQGLLERWLRVLAALPGNLSFVPHIHVRQFIGTWKNSSGEYGTLIWLLQAPARVRHTHTYLHTRGRGHHHYHQNSLESLWAKQIGAWRPWEFASLVSLNKGESHKHVSCWRTSPAHWPQQCRAFTHHLFSSLASWLSHVTLECKFLPPQCSVMYQCLELVVATPSWRFAGLSLKSHLWRPVLCSP